MILPQDNLCGRCRDLDLESYVELRVQKTRGTIAFIEKASLRKACVLCTQFGHIFKTFKTRASNNDSFTLDFRQLQFWEMTFVYFRVRFMEFTRVLDFDFDFYPTTAFIPDLPTNVPSITPFRAMTSELADLGLAKQWLLTCQTSHAECARFETRADSLRVLDCREQKLVSIHSREQYACLSYVWGNQPDVKEPSDTAGDLRHMPQTITNAMFACTALGIPYLWVDRYCIDQNNPIEKHHIISNMDRIYQGAQLTIIASVGEDPRHGLPGIQTTPRRRQLHLNVGSYPFASTENIREQIKTSTWNSRGWTYQEMLLSRRRLVFTDSQMYFQCQCTHYLESVDMAATGDHAALMERTRVFPLLDVSSLQSRLAEYYQRHLSIKTDTVHAFAGVWNHALTMRDTTTPLNTFSHFYGVPIYRYQQTAIAKVGDFLRDLAWRVMHRNVVTNPPDFPLTIPTWSWASPKARHQSSTFSGEYFQPPELMESQLELVPRCISKLGAIVDMEDLLQQGPDHSGFHPQLLFEATILEGFLSRLHSSPGTAYFDSQETLDPKGVVAMNLGVQGADTDRYNKNYDPGTLKEPKYRMICLLLQPLTSAQQLTLQDRPNFVGSVYYRRVGLWLVDVVEAHDSSVEMMEMVCEQLKLTHPQFDWKWRKQALTLV